MIDITSQLNQRFPLLVYEPYVKGAIPFRFDEF